MPTLFESVSQAFPNDAIGQIGKTVGLSPDLVSKGLGAVVPVITGALAEKVASPSGLDGLMKILPSESGATGLGIGDLFGVLKPGAAQNLISNLFGAGSAAIVATLNKRLGFDATPLVAIAAPAVLDLISKTMHARQLDKAGVAQFLLDEQKNYIAQGGANADLVREALDAGREATAIKDQYTADEWQTVRLGPIAAAQVVMLASPSGVVGSIKEVDAVLEALRSGRERAASVPIGLLNIAFGEEVSKDEFMAVAKNRTPAAVLDMVRGALAAVATKNPAEVANYRTLVLDTAQRVAAASMEGGFLGIGGTQVSKEEQTALDQLRNILNA